MAAMVVLKASQGIFPSNMAIFCCSSLPYPQALFLHPGISSQVATSLSHSVVYGLSLFTSVNGHNDIMGNLKSLRQCSIPALGHGLD